MCVEGRVFSQLAGVNLCELTDVCSASSAGVNLCVLTDVCVQPVWLVSTYAS